MFGIKYIEVYGKVTCPYCAKAVNFLKQIGVEFILSLVDQAPSRLHEVMKVTSHVTVPIIFEHTDDGKVNLVGGYDNLVYYMKIKYGIDAPSGPQVLGENTEDLAVSEPDVTEEHAEGEE